EPVADEGAVQRIVRQPQWIEAGRLAAGNPLVTPTKRAKEDLRAPILVEHDRAGREFLRLSRQEVQDNRLARPRRADDREVAEIAVVEVEEVGRRARRLEHADRLAPVIAAGTAHREA